VDDGIGSGTSETFSSLGPWIVSVGYQKRKNFNILCNLDCFHPNGTEGVKTANLTAQRRLWGTLG
jgi:hypothetical protein